MEIFLEKNRSKRSVDRHYGTNVRLSNSHKLLTQSEYDEWISQYDVYMEERLQCRKIRLTCQVNVVASNVLHNNVTEIVKNEGGLLEGDEKVMCLNYGDKGNNDSEISGELIGKKTNTVGFWSKDYVHEAIRDTQLSNSRCNYVYHVGKDFFNNHLVRSLSFRPICNIEEENDNFNTIDDTLRQEETSKTIKENIPMPYVAGYSANTLVIPEVHMYKYDDILPYKDALTTKQKHGFDGWYGFDNIAKMDTFLNFNQDKEESIKINKPINYKNAGDFIDMYPGRDLYSFCPKYNKYRHRLEKNWNYCLTYPSSSTTEVSFIESAVFDETQLPLNALKIYAFDENTKDDNGTKQFVIYSIAKHGLQVGDYVNLYYTNDDVAHVLSKMLRVTAVIDDYIFTLFANGLQISTQWVDTEDEELVDEDKLTVDGMTFDIMTGYLRNDNGVRFPIINGKCNIDEERLHLSYKRVSNGYPNEYYVRIFSKLPNFKYATREVTEEELYKENGTLIPICQKTENEFENHISKLAFAQNIYGDSIGQIVFTDDIRFDSLKDNRKRPLTDIFITFFKNNSGYKEWYGKNGKEIDIANEKVEYSHCFGKLNCGFIESFDSRFWGDKHDSSIYAITNSLPNPINHNSSGLSINYLHPDVERTDVDEDEIDYKQDVNFYGDLVCYDPLQCQEIQIQYVMHRFNTAQRELNETDTAQKYFNNYLVDAIEYDDLDVDKSKGKDAPAFKVSSKKVTEIYGSSNLPCERPEGYFYCPHYKISIRDYNVVNTVFPIFLDIRSFEYDEANDIFTIYTLQQHFFGLTDKVLFYDTNHDLLYYGKIHEVLSPKKFTCTFVHEDGKKLDVVTDDFPLNIYSQNHKEAQYKLFKKSSMDIPEYADLLRDGSCRYLWRNIRQNGENQKSTLEEYPFTNGALYINKEINIHVRRQDPYGEVLWTSSGPSDNIKLFVNRENNYIEEQDIKC